MHKEYLECLDNEIRDEMKAQMDRHDFTQGRVAYLHKLLEIKAQLTKDSYLTVAEIVKGRYALVRLNRYREILGTLTDYGNPPRLDPMLLVMLDAYVARHEAYRLIHSADAGFLLRDEASARARVEGFHEILECQRKVLNYLYTERSDGAVIPDIPLMTASDLVDELALHYERLKAQYYISAGTQ